MLNIEKVDTRNKAQVRRFIQLPFRLYKDHPQWVPPLLIDSETQLNRNKHPFYEHSEADFYLAVRDGRDVGRICALQNKRYNQYHGRKVANFYFFDCEDDQEAANKLFECAFDWAHERGLDTMIGPKGFSVLDGYGLLQDGYQYRQLMNMMNYNYPYYLKLVENLGFEKEVDFVSCFIQADDFHLDERIHRIAERVQKRGNLQVQRFRNKKELIAWVPSLGRAYNNTFVNNWEYYPLTDNEIKFLLDTLITNAVPSLIKIITHGNDAVGFLFGFPDVSASMQRANGRLLPFGLVDILIDLKRTRQIALNGAGILPEYHGVGGNALLYTEMEKTVRSSGQFNSADLTQVAETAVQMRQDLMNLGGKPYKNHRVYRKKL